MKHLMIFAAGIIICSTMVLTSCSDDNPVVVTDDKPWTISTDDMDPNVRPGDDFFMYCRLYTIRGIISKWAPPTENKTEAYIANVSALTGILPDEPLGIPSDQPSRWMMLGAAMAIQENGTESLDYFAMMRGWELARSDVGKT